MFVDQLAHLEDFLKANKMTHTLQTLRQELAARVPTKPSSQLISLLRPSMELQKPQKVQGGSKKKP